MTDRQQRHPTLVHLEPLVGEWDLTATHRMLPGDVIKGRASFAWLDGGQFLIWRTGCEHPAIPDSIAIIGCDDRDGADATGGGDRVVNYVDSRGVYR